MTRRIFVKPIWFRLLVRHPHFYWHHLTETTERQLLALATDYQGISRGGALCRLVRGLVVMAGGWLWMAGVGFWGWGRFFQRGLQIGTTSKT